MPLSTRNVNHTLGEKLGNVWGMFGQYPTILVRKASTENSELAYKVQMQVTLKIDEWLIEIFLIIHQYILLMSKLNYFLFWLVYNLSWKKILKYLPQQSHLIANLSQVH